MINKQEKRRGMETQFVSRFIMTELKKDIYYKGSINLTIINNSAYL